MQTEKTEAYKASAPSMDLEITVRVDDLHADWKRVSYIANYFAEYMAYEFPQRERAENLLSTITNEILEAVINLAPDQTILLVQCRHFGSGFVLDVRHHVKAELSSSYVLFVESLQSEDDKAYLQMLTSDVQPEAYFNQLGLMMLEYDFDVRLSLNMEEELNLFRTHVDVHDEVLSK